ncbi:MAG: type IX secretion system PorP/SprF family membrane protein [Saprospiraceae bacterium]|jgi:type IX secretion system PorP/SprF family membrane protein
MNRLYILSVFLFATSTLLLGQQAPQYSMYMLNKYSYNPAYAGFDNSLSVTGVIRKQWVGLDSSPSTQNINAHMPVYYLGGGLGINLENDELGAERNASASISYNYMIPVSKASTFSIGIAAGIIQKSIDGTNLRAPQGDYSEPPSIIHNDDLIPTGKVSSIAPLINAGVYFHNEKFEIGLASSNIAEPKTSLEGFSLAEITYVRNYFANLAFNFEVGRNFTLQPSVLLKSDLVETQIEFSTIARYNDNIFGGVSFRGYNSNSFDAVVILAGYKLNENLTLSYAYDITLSGLSEVSRGSHEIMLNYNLNKNIGKGRLPKIIYNPRFL